MKSLFPLFLIAAGLLIMTQPKTKRWQERLQSHLGGDQRKVQQRAKTFFILGFAFFVTGLVFLFRL